jgi:plasmid stabilization system protein ParE
MTVRYVLAPEAALDLVQIWRYIKKREQRRDGGSR